MSLPIVIPLHHSGGKFRNNTELRYSLRSVEKHFKDSFEIVIASEGNSFEDRSIHQDAYELTT